MNDILLKSNINDSGPTLGWGAFLVTRRAILDIFLVHSILESIQDYLGGGRSNLRRPQTGPFLLWQPLEAPAVNLSLSATVVL